jgi:hypothetical protein
MRWMFGHSLTINASLAQKDVTQATVVRKLSSYTRQNQAHSQRHRHAPGQPQAASAADCRRAFEERRPTIPGIPTRPASSPRFGR